MKMEGILKIFLLRYVIVVSQTITISHGLVGNITEETGSFYLLCSPSSYIRLNQCLCSNVTSCSVKFSAQNNSIHERLVSIEMSLYSHEDECYIFSSRKLGNFNSDKDSLTFICEMPSLSPSNSLNTLKIWRKIQKENHSKTKQSFIAVFNSFNMDQCIIRKRIEILLSHKFSRKKRDVYYQAYKRSLQINAYKDVRFKHKNYLRSDDSVSSLFYLVIIALLVAIFSACISCTYFNCHKRRREEDFVKQFYNADYDRTEPSSHYSEVQIFGHAQHPHVQVSGRLHNYPNVPPPPLPFLIEPKPLAPEQFIDFKCDSKIDSDNIPFNSQKIMTDVDNDSFNDSCDRTYVNAHHCITSQDLKKHQDVTTISADNNVLPTFTIDPQKASTNIDKFTNSKACNNRAKRDDIIDYKSLPAPRGLLENVKIVNEYSKLHGRQKRLTHPYNEIHNFKKQLPMDHNVSDASTDHSSIPHSLTSGEAMIDSVELDVQKDSSESIEDETDYFNVDIVHMNVMSTRGKKMRKRNAVHSYVDMADVEIVNKELNDAANDSGEDSDSVLYINTDVWLRRYQEIAENTSLADSEASSHNSTFRNANPMDKGCQISTIFSDHNSNRDTKSKMGSTVLDSSAENDRLDDLLVIDNEEDESSDNENNGKIKEILINHGEKLSLSYQYTGEKTAHENVYFDSEAVKSKSKKDDSNDNSSDDILGVYHSLTSYPNLCMDDRICPTITMSRIDIHQPTYLVKDFHEPVVINARDLNASNDADDETEETDDNTNYYNIEVFNKEMSAQSSRNYHKSPYTGKTKESLNVTKMDC